MIKNHPVSPPIALVREWHHQWLNKPNNGNNDSVLQWIATRAAQWASDQELEACCSLALEDSRCGTQRARDLLVERIRERRRPKPPSLAEQAMKALKNQAVRSVPSLTATEDCDTIRRALERLQQFEQENND